MKFTVKFDSSGRGSLAKSKQEYIGLNQVDKVREDLNLPNLSSDRFHAVILNRYHTFLTIELSEDEARETGLFSDTCNIEVEANYDSMSKLFTIEPQVERGPNGEVKSVEFEYKPDTVSIIEAWKALGFPKKIGLEE